MSHDSWVTQRMANRLPPWSDARKLPHSFFQQFLNPVGEELEELNKWSINQRRNLYLTTANLDAMDIIYSVKLPSDFQFGRDLNSLNAVRYIAPLCKGNINGKEVWIEVADGNNLDSLWYDSIPTRVEYVAARVDVTAVLEETELGDLDSASIGEIVWPTRLAVTISDCNTFVDLSRREVFSFIVLHGTTLRGLEEDEVMIIPYNGLFLTRKIWKELTSIEYYGLQPSNGTITIDCFSFNKSREVDKYQLYVTPDNEKLMYHRLYSKEFQEGTYSVHQFMTVTADTLGDLYSGNDILQVVKEVELLYNGENILLHDIAVQPFTGRIFGIDDTFLYIFSPYGSAPDYRGMREKSAGPMMVIAVDGDNYDYVRGDSVTLSTYWRKPTERIYKNRWSVRKPDGTLAYIDIDGVESSNNDWIYNKTYTELVFGPFESTSGDIDKQVIEYSLTQRGTYQFTLEVQYTNGTVEKDVVPVQVHSKAALARLRLPTGLQGSEGIAFDSDQKLWLLKREDGESGPYQVPTTYGVIGRAFRMHLAVDKMVIDFENKIIYLREDYDSIDIDEAEDMVVKV